MKRAIFLMTPLGVGLAVAGLTAIAWGSVATFGGLFGAGILILVFRGVWALRASE